MTKTQMLGVFFFCVAIFTGSGIANAASSVQLNWSIPTTRENGQALAVSELTGYEIYYVTENLTSSGTVKVSGGSTSSYSVQNLVAGNYYFAIAAVDTGGTKSKLSSTAKITVSNPLPASTTTIAVPNAPAPLGASTSSSTISSLKTISLRWTMPTKRTNGTTLPATDLSGYQIQYKGPKDVSYLTMRLQGASITNHIFSNMIKGQYAFSVVAIDKNGVKSRAVSLTITAS